MSGHSKWANIKHKKGKSDAQKAKVFTKLGRELQIAVKSGGPDPESNSKLKDIIAKAKAANMPNDNIQRSIKKASVLLKTSKRSYTKATARAELLSSLRQLPTTETELPQTYATFLINSAVTSALQAAFHLCLNKKVSSLSKEMTTSMKIWL